MQDYGTETKCERALFCWRFPSGYVCQECGNRSYCRLKCRKLLQCNHCNHQISLTSQTLFAYTKLPLTKWLMAIYLLSQAKTGLSAMALKRQIGVSYNTAWMMKHKLLQAMKESDDKSHIGGIIQVDDVYWGGEKRGGKRGRGSENKTPFVAAVALNEEGHPIRMKLMVVEGFSTNVIEQWINHHLHPGSVVISDGLNCFTAFDSPHTEHVRVVTGGNLDLMDHPAFKWVNVMIGNVKTSIRGSCHAIRAKHLPRYLAEYCYRFNNRFDLRELFPKLVKTAIKTPAMPYRLLKMAESCG
jgi:hypothetical protein